MIDYYKVLGLTSDAEEKEIRAAYRKKAKKYHPDAGEGSSAEAFREIQDAYELLSDPGKRREYDRSRAPAVRVRTTFYSPEYSAGPKHLDLRDIISKGTRAYAEPISGLHSSGRDVVEDPWEDLLDYLFRGF